MKHLILICAVALPPQAASAQQAETPFGLSELAPFADSFKELFEGFTEDMMPLMEQLSGKMSEMHVYEPPVVLPNGDILIRRKAKPEGTPDAEPKANPDGSIDL